MNRCTSAADKLGRLALALMLASALSSCTKAELIGAKLSSLQSLASAVTAPPPPPLPTLALDSTPVTVAEGSVATFTVTLSQASVQTVTVDYATVNGTAKSSRDYTAATGTLTFAPGVTTQNLTVTTLANSLYSDPLTYQVQLSNAVNATAGSPGSGIINNTDAPPTISFFNATNYEGCGAIFVARQSAVTLKDTVITWHTSDGSGLAGTRYTAVNTTTTLPAGALEVGLSVPLLDDSVTNGDGTFTVNIDSIVGATVSGGSTATGTIKDKSTTIPSFTQINKNPAGTFTMNGTWMSSDGCYIVYNATQDSAMFELFTASPFGTSQLKITHPFPTGADGASLSTSLTPDSKRILYIADQETKQIPELYSVKPDGTGWTKVNPTLTATSNGVSPGYYAMSGDGTKFAYKVDTGGGSAYELYVANVDGTSNRKVNDPLASGGCIQNSPSFAPDSSKIGYYGGLVTATTSDLYVDATDGSGSNTRLTPSMPSGAAGVDAFKFTPDGQKIVFTGDLDTPGIDELYVVNIDGSNRIKLNGALAADIIVSEFRISHDSQKVSYGTYDTSGSSFTPSAIYAVNIDGTAPATLHAAGNNIWFSNGGFSPDDSRVVYIGNYGSTIVRSNTMAGTNELSIGSYAGWDNLNADIYDILSDGRVLYSSLSVPVSSFVWSAFIAPADGSSSPKRLTTASSQFAPSLYVAPDLSYTLVSYSSSDPIACATVHLDGTSYTTLSPAGKACEIDGQNWTRKIAVFYGDLAGAGKSYIYTKSIP